MEELRGALRETTERIEGPSRQGILLLDDINKLQIRLWSETRGVFYESYPESHHVEEEER